MVLKNQVEWALHCCALLARLPADRFIPAKDLAEFHGVPKEYLSKALQALSQAGLVLTTLGPSGGYRLAKPVSAISFLDIVEAVEGERLTFACTEIRMNNPCRLAKHRDGKPCAIASIMYGADEAWRAHLRAITLESLLETLVKELPKDLMRASGDWIEGRLK